MELEAEARDCLYVNWAIPAESVPPLPAPLRYETHDESVFVSMLLLRLSDLHWKAAPVGRISYPQAALRFYVFDGDDVPAVFFRSTYVPWWVLPVARVLGRQPVRPARMRFPKPSRDRDAECWRWRLGRRRRELTLTAGLASPSIGPGPDLGCFEAVVDHFRQRSRGYVRHGDRVKAVRTARPMVSVWPMRVEVESARLLESALPTVSESVWREPHSAWLSPQIPFRFEVGPEVDRALARRRALSAAAEGA